MNGKVVWTSGLINIEAIKWQKGYDKSIWKWCLLSKDYKR